MTTLLVTGHEFGDELDAECARFLEWCQHLAAVGVRRIWIDAHDWERLKRVVRLEGFHDTDHFDWLGVFVCGVHVRSRRGRTTLPNRSRSARTRRLTIRPGWS